MCLRPRSRPTLSCTHPTPRSRAFWHCLPFASAGIAAAVVKFGTQKLWSDERPPARALQSWQLQQAVVPAVQLGVRQPMAIIILDHFSKN